MTETPTDRVPPRRKWKQALVIGCFFGMSWTAISVLWQYGTPRYWKDFTGLTVDQLVTELGPSPIAPIAIGDPADATQGSIHQWPTGLGRRLILVVDAEGTAVYQYRDHKWATVYPQSDAPEL